MRRGETRERLDAGYFLPSLVETAERVERSRFPRLALRELIGEIVGGATPRLEDGDQYAEDGIRFLRILNVGDGEIIADDMKYITQDVHDGLLRRSQLFAGDVVMSITGRVGNAAVVPESLLPANINQHLVAMRLRDRRCKNAFLIEWLNSPTGLALTNRQVSGGSRVALDYERIRALRIPLPPLAKQRELVDAMEVARETRRAKLTEADALLAGMDAYLLETLGLAAPPDTPRKTFAVPASAVAGKRLDPPAYQPLVSQSARGGLDLCDLQDLADIDAHAVEKPGSEDALVPYVGLPECDLTEVREMATRPYREVKGRSVARTGDILFARIEPSVFNKKYVLAENLHGHDFAYTSTEFYVVTPRADQVVPEYLYAMFFCSFVFAQIKGKTTGSSGRRRLDPGMFRTLQIPVPDTATQQSIAVEIRRRRERARTLRAEAEQGWAEAKRWFEEQLLGAP